MISAINLVWIIPAAAMFGFAICAIVSANKH